MHAHDGLFQKHHSHTHHRGLPTASQNSHPLFLLPHESADFQAAKLLRASRILQMFQLQCRYNHLQTSPPDSAILKFVALHDEENICLQVHPSVFQDVTSK